jgi:RNA polymerase sigma-70 factor, ECF subfamily
MSAAEPRSDEYLMEQLGLGYDDALADIVERYQNDVFRFCLHYLKNVELAKEMAQETFLRIYAARDRFDKERKFKPWMLCIARNLCLNELKRKKTVQMETLEEFASTSRDGGGEMLHSAADGPAEQLMAQERHAALWEALRELPEDAREIVVLRYFERMSAREIAEVVDSTEGAIRTRIHRVLKQLREQCLHFRDDV